MGDQCSQIHLLTKDEIHCLFLQIHRSTVGPQERFLINANRCRINCNFTAHRLRKQHNAAAEAGCVDCALDQAVTSNRKYDGVCSTAISQSPDMLKYIRPSSIDCFVDPVAIRYCKPLLVQVRRYYSCTCPPGQDRENNPYGPLSNYQDGFSGLELQGLNRLQTSIDRLDERRLFEGDVIRDPHHATRNNPAHNAHIIGESTSGRFKTRSTTHLLVNRALSEHFMFTVVTIPAWNVVKDHY